MQAYGVYRCTRLDVQQTIRTKKRLTPWWITEFEEGRLRVVGKKHYEPRGKKDHLGERSAGATLYHGSRSSDRFARQYDKHLESGQGPERRRDEVEAKGESARNLWSQMHEELLLTEQLGTSRGATLHSFSKSTIRALLPIRDTSRWAGKPLPKKWSVMAKEPNHWATLFDGDAIQVKPRERKVTSLLKSYRYANDNFGSAISLMFTTRYLANRKAGMAEEDAAKEASLQGLDEAFLGANEDRVREFIGELPPSEREAVLRQWIEGLSNAASNNERIRD